MRARIERLGRTAITTHIDILRGEEMLLEGELVHVCVDTENWAKTEIPEWVRAGLGRFVAE
jgi:acyl-CoA thioesterase FadM